MLTFALLRNRARLLVFVASAMLAGCETAHRDDPADRPDEVPPPVQFDAGKGSSILAFSPDGRTLVTGGGPLRFWDVATGKQTLQQLSGESALSFSPDGLRLAFQGYNSHIHDPMWTLRFQEFGSDGHARSVWRIAVGERVSNHTFASAVAFSPDSRTAAFGSSDESIQIWDAVTGKELQSFRGGVAVCYSLDGKELLAVRHSGGLRRFDATTGKPLSDVKRGERPDFLWVSSVAFSADRRRVASADYHTILLKDVETGETYARIELEDQVRALHFTPDCQTLVIPCFGSVVVCNGETGAERGRFYPHTDTWTRSRSAPMERCAPGWRGLPGTCQMAWFTCAR